MMNVFAVVVFGLFLLWAYRHSALAQHRLQRDYLNRFTLFSLGLLALWGMRAGIFAGLQLHFVGLTLLTLILGWRSALCAATLVQVTLLLTGFDHFDNAGALLWLGVALPILASFAWLTLCHNLLPKNFWVYVFVGSFFNALLSFTLRTLALALYYHGQYDWQVVFDNYLMLLPLFLFPEAMLNGFATVLLVIYKPEWLATWNERRYLFKDDKQ